MANSARLEELRKKFDENPRRYFAPLANEYRKQGDLAQAIALCRTHLPNQPGHISGHIVLGQALYETHELNESHGIFEQALELDPENLIALRYLGDIAREQGSPASAQAWYQRVLDADPRNDEIAELMRAVEAGAAAAVSELASRQTPAASEAVGAVSADAPMQSAESGAPSLPQAAAAPPSDVQGMDSAGVPPAHAWLPAEAVSEPIVGWDEAEPAPIVDEPAAWFQEPAATVDASAPTPIFTDLVEPPAPESLGEIASVAEADLSEWFTTAPPTPAPAAVPEADLFPDFSAEFTTTAAAPTEATPADSLADAIAREPVLEWSEAVGIEARDEHREVPLLELDHAHADQEPGDNAGIIDEDRVVGSTWWSELKENEPSRESVNQSEDVRELEVQAFDENEEPAESLAAPTSQADAEPAVGSDREWTDAGAGHDVFEAFAGRTPDLAANTPEEPPAPFVTETMAELYLQQGFNEEALAIYRQLLQQSPGDETLKLRVQALEEGERSPVVTPLTSPIQGVPAGPSVREFFLRFAKRVPGGTGVPEAPDVAGHASGSLGGAATHDEALTRPDDSAASAGGLDEVFGGLVPAHDAEAASSLAAAFAAGHAPSHELSLDSLFGEVPAMQADAVTSATGSAPEPSTSLAAGPDGEAIADIEQFTAWLEGLKKK